MGRSRTKGAGAPHFQLTAPQKYGGFCATLAPSQTLGLASSITSAADRFVEFQRAWGLF